MARKQKYRYNIYMMKSGISDIKSAIDDSKNYETHDVKREVASNALILKEKQGPNYEPKWKKKLDHIAKNPIGPVENNSSSAVLWVQTSGRVFAIPFGHGRKFIKEDAVERRFGLKVALNSVDPHELKSVDAKSIDTLSTNKHFETSQMTEIHAFGVDLQRDIMRAVAGQPRKQSFASRVVGKDSVAIVTDKDMNQVENILKEAKEFFDSEAYKSDFSFVDNISPVQDPERKRRLDEILLDGIKNRDEKKMSLSFPEYVSWDFLEGIRYKGEQNDTRHEDLDITEALDAVMQHQKEKLQRELKIVDLQKVHKISLYAAEARRAAQDFSIYRCLNFETEDQGKVAVLSAGEWYEIEGEFVNELNQTVDAALGTPSIPLPASSLGEVEKDYNERVCKSAPEKTVNFDADNIRPNKGETKIEVCDIYTNANEFIHVKRKTRSSTLSHLFSQGSVSGLSFVQSEYFRREISKRLPASFPQIEIENRPDTTKYSVFYVVVEKRTGKPSDLLPFFSKQTFAMNKRQLDAFGYKVALVFVEAK
jgi:uncharacterized protein (TIGR04141 family)